MNRRYRHSLPIERPLMMEIEFCAWLGQAEPGDALEYHRGFLVVDLTPFGGSMGSEARLELARTSARAYGLAERGFGPISW